MSNKTPFEIRLEILQMAKEYMDKAQAAQIEFAKDAFYKAVEFNQLTSEQIKEQIKSFIPAQYTTDELMKKAAEMLTFINKKD